MNKYATEVSVAIAATDGPDIDLSVKLTACPKYKLGAYYVGRLLVAGITFKVKAICVCSTAGGRGWYAWDEKLEDMLKFFEIGDSNRRAISIDITPPGGEHAAGEYIVCIHPVSESFDDDE